MKLLLHTCCAPCAIYPLEVAEKDFDAVAGFFYNPNIHPYPEFLKRQEESGLFFKSRKIEFIKPSYDVENYFRVVDFLPHNAAKNPAREEVPARCLACWRMRIFESARLAKENSFDSFSTTLLGSPYQDHEALKGICSEASKKYSVDFYYRDFRKGFREAHKKAKESGIYCQNYCGCIYSETERLVKKAKGITLPCSTSENH